MDEVYRERAKEASPVVVAYVPTKRAAGGRELCLLVSLLDLLGHLLYQPTVKKLFKKLPCLSEQSAGKRQEHSSTAAAGAPTEADCWASR